VAVHENYIAYDILTRKNEHVTSIHTNL